MHRLLFNGFVIARTVVNLHCNETGFVYFNTNAREKGRERRKETTFRSGFRGFCGSSFRFFREGIKRLPSNKYRERDVSSLLASCGKVDRSSFEMDGRRGKLDRIDFIRDVNDYPILTRIYRIHLSLNEQTFHGRFPSTRR